MSTLNSLKFQIRSGHGTSLVGPVGKTLSFQCRGHRFHPWSGNQDSACPMAKKKVISALHLTNADQYVSSPKVLKLFSHSIVSNSLRELDCSMPSFPVHHQLLELAQTHVHQVGDVIQSSHPLLFPSPAFDLSQHQRLFQ